MVAMDRAAVRADAEARGFSLRPANNAAYTTAACLLFVLLGGCMKRARETRLADPPTRRAVPPTRRAAPPTRFDPAAVASVVELDYHGKPLCSGVRVSSTDVLTAAHCVVGLHGRAQRSELTTKGGRALYLVEVGDFLPDKGRLSDFAILRGRATPGAAVARLASREELLAARHVDDSLASHAVRVWAVGFSERAHRSPPRPAPDGHSVFVSPGWLKSDTAYRRATVLAVQHGFVFDDTLVQHLPVQSKPLRETWQGMATNTLFRIYAEYHAVGDPILYHSADYAPGASGGGVFLADGRLVGIIPYGASAFPRTLQYPGFGQLYRIDVICRDSTVLASLAACRELSGRSAPARAQEPAAPSAR